MDNEAVPSPPSDGWRRLAFAVRLAVVAAAILIPLRILANGHFPVDDAKRHAAKVISGRSWSDIVVIRPDMTAVDSNPGWHALLGLVHRVTAADGFELVWFSIAF